MYVEMLNFQNATQNLLQSCIWTRVIAEPGE